MDNFHWLGCLRVWRLEGQVTERIGVRIGGSWLISNGVVIGAQGQRPPLDTTRGHGRYCMRLAKDVREWLVVRLDNKTPAIR